MISRDKSYYPADTTEYRIQEVLVPLIKEIREKAYSEDFKNSEVFNTEQTELEVLGLIVSKYCEWAGNRIEQVAMAAFEDSNFDALIEY